MLWLVMKPANQNSAPHLWLAESMAYILAVPFTVWVKFGLAG